MTEFKHPFELLMTDPLNRLMTDFLNRLRGSGLTAVAKLWQPRAQRDNSNYKFSWVTSCHLAIPEPEPEVERS